MVAPVASRWRDAAIILISTSHCSLAPATPLWCDMSLLSDVMRPLLARPALRALTLDPGRQAALAHRSIGGAATTGRAPIGRRWLVYLRAAYRTWLPLLRRSFLVARYDAALVTAFPSPSAPLPPRESGPLSCAVRRQDAPSWRPDKKSPSWLDPIQFNPIRIGSLRLGSDCCCQPVSQLLGQSVCHAQRGSSKSIRVIR